jgi:hypothetical protein
MAALTDQDEVVRLQERIAAAMASGGQGKDVEGARDQEMKPIRGERVPCIEKWGGQLKISSIILSLVSSSPPPFPPPSVGSDVNARLKGVMQAHAASDRDMMLRQIEALKVARQEAETFKLDNGRLSDELTATVRELADVRRHHNDALARLKDQSEAMLYAVQGRGPGNASEGVVTQVRAG